MSESTANPSRRCLAAELRFSRQGQFVVAAGADRADRGRGLRAQATRGLGYYPAAIDTCLAVAEDYDVQVCIHTDTLNESGFVEDTLAAFKDRAIHTYHAEGAGGGHPPDII